MIAGRTTAGAAIGIGEARLAARITGAREGWPNTSAQLASETRAACRGTSPDHLAGMGSDISWMAGSTAMAIGLLSTSAWAAPARASQPASNTTMPVRTVRVDVACVVAMDGRASKAQASHNILNTLVFYG